MASKFYVVWKGRETGIFTDWASCKRQVDQFPGARYKSFKTRSEAETAFGGSTSGSTGKAAKSTSVQKNRLAKTPSMTKLAAASRKRPANGVKTYTASEIKAMKVDTKIFTDGGCEPNPGEAGSGVAVYRNDQISELWYGLYNPKGTNNTAELNALHQALLMAVDELKNDVTIAIFCDSKYAIQCVTQWAVNWQKKGWKKAGGEIKNLELIKELFALHQQLKTKVKVLHVNGHVGVEGNELADRMSILAIEQRDVDFSRYPAPLDIDAILALRTG